MPRRDLPGTRTAWLVIWGAMTFTPVLYTAVAIVLAPGIAPSSALPTLRLVFISLSAACVATAIALFARVPRVPTQGETSVPAFATDAPAPPALFMSRFVTGAALAEVAAIDGFVLVFLGERWTTCAILGAVTMAVMLGVALPAGLRYWSEREREDAGGMPAIE